MGDIEPLLRHGGKYGFRRRRRSGEEFNRMSERPFLLGGRIENCRHHNWRPAKGRNTMGGKRFPD
jgi:hypothetical protein